MSKRLQGLLKIYSGKDTPIPATVRAVAAYAAQNPGLEFANYGNASSYRADSRRIGAALERVRIAIREAYFANVTDSDMVDASRGAFSGRLELRPAAELGQWFVDYTTGQYWPMEYRNAAASVLECAAEISRDRRAAASVAPVEQQA